MSLAKKPFVVLDAELLSSSVWAEAAHVRLVWITLLILCDTEGYVGAAVPGIASAAGVTLAEAEDALDRLQKPDRYSRTQAHEGRRVEVAERGFRVLNFLEHLDRLSSERAKARDRVWRSRQRSKARNATPPTPPDDETPCDDTASTEHRQSPQGEGSSEQGQSTSTDTGPADSVRSPEQSRIIDLVPVAEVIHPGKAPKRKRHAAGWVSEAGEDWEAASGGTASFGRIGKALGSLVAKLGWEVVRPAWQAFLVSPKRQFGPDWFAANAGDFTGESVRQVVADDEYAGEFDDIDSMFKGA